MKKNINTEIKTNYKSKEEEEVDAKSKECKQEGMEAQPDSTEKYYTTMFPDKKEEAHDVDGENNDDEGR